jgi:hypothetical protein
MGDEKTTEEDVSIGLENILPHWTEFTLMGNLREATNAVRKFFINDEASLIDFEKTFGVRLDQYIGYYLETGTADAPTGPCLSGRISPILVLKQSRSGKNFSVHLFKHDGLVNERMGLAWIDRASWEKFVDDTFAEELRKQAERFARLKKEAEKSDSNEQ